MEEESQNRNILSFIDPHENTIGFLGFLFAVVALIGLVSYSAFNQPEREKAQVIPPKESAASQTAPYTLVYGFWEGNSSVINSLSLSSGKIYNLAKLPSNVKGVTVFAPNKILFIANTDANDSGSQISVFDVSSKQATLLASADTGFGIDDYVISPNKRYLATWEVSIQQNAQDFLGAKSRVYTVDLQNLGNKNLIHDEVSIKGFPVHYPLAIKDDGQLFLDRYEANAIFNGLRGVSVSSFDGREKQELAQMAGGTFSTQPILSPNGAEFVFAGSTIGAPISPSDINEFIRIITQPDTIDILDTTSLARIRLVNAKDTDKFKNIYWDKITGNILYFLESENQERKGFYAYDKNTSLSKKFSISTNNAISVESLRIIGSLDNHRILLAHQEPSESAIGNLGPGYHHSITSIAIYNLGTKNEAALNINQKLFQYIDIVDGAFFDSVQNLTARKGGVLKDPATQGKQLQLDELVIKPSIVQKRLEQRSRPVGGSFPPLLRNWLFPVHFGFAVCKPAIYLYPESKIPVNVKINSSIPFTKTDPQYSEGGWNVIADPSGDLLYGTSMYNYLYYEASVSDSLIEKPKEGFVVAYQELRSFFGAILPKLGLNTAETIEFSDYWIKALPKSPYYLAKIISQENINKIFSFDITPKPKSIIRVNLYFEALDKKIDVPLPFIRIPERQGFTIVEWGGMFKRDKNHPFTCLE